jgi:hypothetical protein
MIAATIGYSDFWFSIFINSANLYLNRKQLLKGINNISTNNHLFWVKYMKINVAKPPQRQHFVLSIHNTKLPLYHTQ